MKAKVTADTANVRFRTGGTIAGRLDKGTVIQVLREEGSWCVIQYYGKERYLEKANISYIEDEEVKQARVIVPALHVRQRPWKTIIGKVHLNDRLQVLNEDNGWARITWKDKPAYVSSEYLEFYAGDKKLAGRGVITIPGLNVRSKPQGEKIGVVKDDEVLDITGSKNGWYTIDFKGETGYVYGKYVNKFTARVKPPKLNIREKPGGKITGTAQADELLPYLVEEERWLQVIMEGQKGWADARYLEKLTHAPDKEIQADKSYVLNNKDLHKIGLEPIHKVEVSGDQDSRTIGTIWNNYGNLMQELSDHLDIDIASAMAVFAVESRGEGFWKKNHSIIRFEAHVFDKFWGSDNEQAYRRHFKYNPTRRWTGQAFRAAPEDDWTDLHTGDNYQQKEWQALEIARNLDEEKALEACSIGAPQILGANYSRIGYPSVQDMFEHFNKHIRFHIFGFFDFLDDEMIAYIQKTKYQKFAAKYNGPGNAEHYGKKIADYADLYKKTIG